MPDVFQAREDGVYRLVPNQQEQDYGFWERVPYTEIVEMLERASRLEGALRRIARLPEKFTTPGANEYLNGVPCSIRESESRLATLGVRHVAGYAQAIDVATAIAGAALAGEGTP